MTTPLVPPRQTGSAAVLGSPISHSLSPVLHRAAYAALGLPGWTFEAIRCEIDDLPAVLDESWPLRRHHAVTMPCKRAALEAAGRRSERAEAIGAANTLLATDDGWYADNTDWIGVRDALAEAGVTPAGRSVAVLGAGGTAQAVLAAVAGAHRVTVSVRDRARAADLLRTAERLGIDVTLAALGDPAPVAAADVVVSTLPSGASTAVPADGWRPGQVLLDVVYSPWPTAPATAAAAAGATVVSGAVMLLWQAVEQVRLMTGRPGPAPAMRAAMREAAPGIGV